MFLKFIVVFLCVIGLVASNDEFIRYDERESFAEELSHGDSEHQQIPLDIPINLFSEKYHNVYVSYKLGLLMEPCQLINPYL